MFDHPPLPSPSLSLPVFPFLTAIPSLTPLPLLSPTLSFFLSPTSFSLLQSFLPSFTLPFLSSPNTCLSLLFFPLCPLATPSFLSFSSLFFLPPSLYPSYFLLPLVSLFIPLPSNVFLSSTLSCPSLFLLPSVSFFIPPPSRVPHHSSFVPRLTISPPSSPSRPPKHDIN